MQDKLPLSSSNSTLPLPRQTSRCKWWHQVQEEHRSEARAKTRASISSRLVALFKEPTMVWYHRMIQTCLLHTVFRILTVVFKLQLAQVFHNKHLYHQSRRKKDLLGRRNQVVLKVQLSLSSCRVLVSSIHSWFKDHVSTTCATRMNL